jgi:hypothetical protein
MERLQTIVQASNWRRRKYRRFELEFPVNIKFSSGSEVTNIDAVSKNISVGGLLARSATSIPEDTAVTFILSVYGKAAVRPVRLLGEGYVVRIEPGEKESTFGVAMRCNAPLVQLEEYLPGDKGA